MKKGFTLVEIMAVITVLGIISLIAVVAVDKSIKDNNEKLYQIQVSNIEDAARIWGTNNLSYLPDTKDEAVSIPLLLLKRDSLIDKEIKNPKTNELFYNNMYIDITYQNGTYVYNLVEDSGTDGTNDLDVPVIILYDTLNKTISSSTTLEKKGVVLLRNGSKVDLETYGYNTTSNEDGTSNYSITVDDGKSFTMVRKITVE